MKDSQVQDAQVLVIGAGPVGLLLANLLGSTGTPTVLLEKRLAGGTVPSMAIGVMPPSLRHLETIDLAAPLVQAGCAVRTAVVRATLIRHALRHGPVVRRLARHFAMLSIPDEHPAASMPAARREDRP